MSATAADLPPELFEPVLSFVVSDMDMTKRDLGMCALVCTFWADKVQPSLFKRITLRRREDVDMLTSFIESPESRVAEYLDFVDLQQEGPAPPWFHLAALLLKRPGVVFSVSVSLERPQSHDANNIRPLRSIHSTLPRSLPTFSANVYQLHLTNTHFRKFSDLAHLVGEIPKLMELSCAKVTWKDTSPTGIPLPARLARSLRSAVMDECTDLRSAIWFFLGPSRLHPRAIPGDPYQSFNLAAEDQLAVNGLLRTFQDTSSVRQFMFHQTPSELSLAINEPFNDDLTTDSALRLQPNIDFMFSNILSHLHPIAPPIPATFIDTSHISSITVDFHLFDLDQCCTCDWTAFDNLASSLAHMEKVVFGFRCQDDLRQFTALPDRLTKLSETDKIRYGYWDESRELWMHLLQADADEFIPTSEYLGDL